MNAFAQDAGPRVVRSIRERGGVSLERVTPRRPPRDHHLVLAPEAALSYLRELVVELGLEKRIISLPLPPLEGLLATCRQHLRNAGPFQRIHCVLEWDGRDPQTIRSDWETFREGVFTLAEIRPRLICCRPVFEQWILLHFEPFDPRCAEAEWVRERVAEWVPSQPGSDGLLLRTVFHLGTALRRAQDLARARSLLGPDDTLPVMPGTHLHELILSWYKLARRTLPEETPRPARAREG